MPRVLAEFDEQRVPSISTAQRGQLGCQLGGHGHHGLPHTSSFHGSAAAGTRVRGGDLDREAPRLRIEIAVRGAPAADRGEDRSGDEAYFHANIEPLLANRSSSTWA
jgi:hypothetical protein